MHVASPAIDVGASADTVESIRLRADVFDERMRRYHGITTVVGQARALRIHRSMMSDLRAGKCSCDLRLAFRAARLARTTVERLFAYDEDVGHSDGPSEVRAA